MPAGSSSIDHGEELIEGSFLNISLEAATLKLLQQDVQLIEIAVTQMHRGTLVTVKVEHRGWISRTLALEIVSIVSGRRDQRHKRIHALDRIVEHQTTFCNDVMTAAHPAAEQFYEIVALAINLLVGIDAVIRNQHHCCLVRQRAFLNRRPDLTDNCVHAL